MEEENQFSAVTNTKNPQEYLFNIVSSCFLKEVRYYDTEDERVNLIIKALNAVKQIEPEFILQLAFYLRTKLYLRTTTNFIVAYCTLQNETSKLLGKYFNKTILLPTDLLEVCQYTQFIRLKETTSIEKLKEIDIRQHIKIPHSLIKAIQQKFPEFSEYQLGKYCSENNRKKMLFNYKSFKDFKKYNATIKKQKDKIAEKKKQIEEGEDKEKKYKLVQKQQVQKKMIKKHNKGVKKNPILEKPKNWWDLKFICMKDLISLCHIKEPQYLVKCILTRKYPETIEDFNKQFTAEEQEKFKLKFQENQIQKKLRLTIPKTWETEISSNGNKPEIWEKLILSNQLPYMATLRNLKNLAKVGLAEACHLKVIANLQNQSLVQNSKIFPLQYFTALSEISNLKVKEEKEEKDEEIKENLENLEKQKIINANIQSFTETYSKQYQAAIENAIKISIDKNLQQIQGHTIVFADVSGSMCTPISGGKRYGSIRQCREVAMLLGLMIREKCDKCTYYVFSSVGQCGKCYFKVNFEGNNIKENMDQITKSLNQLGGGTDFPVEVIQECISKKVKVDNIVILSDMMISDGHQNIGTTNQVITDYKNQINDSLKVFSINLTGYGKSLNLGEEFSEKNFIRIFGMSDAVLAFISLREQSQIEAIRQYAQNAL